VDVGVDDFERDLRGAVGLAVDGAGAPCGDLVPPRARRAATAGGLPSLDVDTAEVRTLLPSAGARFGLSCPPFDGAVATSAAASLVGFDGRPRLAPPAAPFAVGVLACSGWLGASRELSEVAG
jgi:hypothetical protein